MPRPTVLQIGRYREWDQVRLDQSCDIERLFVADGQVFYLSQGRAIAAPSELGAACRFSIRDSRRFDPDASHCQNRRPASTRAPSMIINILCASNIDQGALITACTDRTLRAAAPDVIEGEPDLDNALVQPHHASGTTETRQAIGRLRRDHIAAHFAGQNRPTPVV